MTTILPFHIAEGRYSVNIEPLVYIFWADIGPSIIFPYFSLLRLSLLESQNSREISLAS